MASVLVTGSNRGIGLGLVKHILAQNGPFKVVIATYRNPDGATELMELKKQYPNLHTLKLDVSDLDSFKGFAKEVESVVGENGLNVLINNAGAVLSERSGNFANVSQEEYMKIFKINTFGPVFLCQALLPLLLTAAKRNSGKPLGMTRAAILNMSSKLGSVTDNGSGGYWAYRESKSALNQFSRNLAKELLPQGVLVTVLHPGHVKTDMGTAAGLITVEECVSGLYNLMSSLNESKTDKFFQWDGKEVVW